jgi:hypothetical protein
MLMVFVVVVVLLLWVLLEKMNCEDFEMHADESGDLRIIKSISSQSWTSLPLFALISIQLHFFVLDSIGIGK